MKQKCHIRVSDTSTINTNSIRLLGGQKSVDNVWCPSRSSSLITYSVRENVWDQASKDHAGLNTVLPFLIFLCGCHWVVAGKDQTAEHDLGAGRQVLEVLEKSCNLHCSVGSINEITWARAEVRTVFYGNLRNLDAAENHSIRHCHGCWCWYSIAAQQQTLHLNPHGTGGTHTDRQRAGGPLTTALTCYIMKGCCVKQLPGCLAASLLMVTSLWVTLSSTMPFWQSEEDVWQSPVLSTWIQLWQAAVQVSGRAAVWNPVVADCFPRPWCRAPWPSCASWSPGVRWSF